MMNDVEAQKALDDIATEIALNINGITCSSKHVKTICRERVNYLNWKANRIMKNQNFDNPPTTRTVSKFKLDL